MNILIFVLFISLSWFYKKIFNDIHVSVIDVPFYYDTYLMKVCKGEKVNWFYNLLFIKRKWFSNPDAVPIYRVFQFMVASALCVPIYLIYAYFHFPLWVFIADILGSIFWAVYWLKFDWKFYQRSDIFEGLKKMINDKDKPFWLKHWFQSGKWLFKSEWTIANFELSSTIGTAGYYFISIIVFGILFLRGG